VRRVLLLGHFTKDIIDVEGRLYTSLGGPPLYAGLLLSSSPRHKPIILTRFGRDYPRKMLSLLRDRGIELHGNPLSRKPTTCFLLKVNRGDFTPYLKARCADITNDWAPDPDAAILNPVAREVSVALARECRRNSEVVYTDPQGFLRRWDRDGTIRLAQSRTYINVLRLVDAAKMDTEEIMVSTRSSSLDHAIRKVFKIGVRYLLLTRGPITRLYTNSHIYEYKGRILRFADAVGLGDLLGGGFVAGLLEGDPVWGLALGVAAATAKPSEVGIKKVPDWRLVEKNANEIYQRIRRLR
jgi:sugar/nucleoside kinase (ribokinase family)